MGIGAKRPGLVPNRPGSYGTSGMHGQRGERQASTMISVDQVDIGMRQRAGKIISLSLLSSSLHVHSVFIFHLLFFSLFLSLLLYTDAPSAAPLPSPPVQSPLLPFLSWFVNVYFLNLTAVSSPFSFSPTPAVHVAP